MTSTPSPSPRNLGLHLLVDRHVTVWAGDRYYGGTLTRLVDETDDEGTPRMQALVLRLSQGESGPASRVVLPWPHVTAVLIQDAPEVAS